MQDENTKRQTFKAWLREAIDSQQHLPNCGPDCICHAIRKHLGLDRPLNERLGLPKSGV